MPLGEQQTWGLTMNYDCRCIDCQCEPEQGSVADDVTTEAPSQRTATRHVRARKPCSRPPVAVEPPLGAHLLSPRWGYTHQGIYAGQGRVIHYAGLSRRVSRGPVEEVSLEAFARNRGIAIQCRDRLPFDEQEIVARARSRLGEDRYRIWSNNCEHFSLWSLSGESRSEQVERVAAPLRRLQRALSSWVALLRPRAPASGEMCHEQ